MPETPDTADAVAVAMPDTPAEAEPAKPETPPAVREWWMTDPDA